MAVAKMEGLEDCGKRSCRNRPIFIKRHEAHPCRYFLQQNGKDGLNSSILAEDGERIKSKISKMSGRTDFLCDAPNQFT